MCVGRGRCHVCEERREKVIKRGEGTEWGTKRLQLPINVIHVYLAYSGADLKDLWVSKDP